MPPKLSRDTLIRVLKNCAAIAFGLFVSFLLVEVVLRIYNPFQFRLKGDQIQLPINRVYEISNSSIPELDASITHTKNELGFRGPAFPENDVYKIFCVGGSTTECFYQNDTKTWPELLQGKLNEKRDDDVWINNAGLDGHSTFGHSVLLKQHVLNLQPDMIVFLIGANDVGRRDLNRHDNKLQFKGRTGIHSVIFTLTRYSETANLVFNLIQVSKARKKKLTHQSVDMDTLKPATSKTDVNIEAIRKQERQNLDAYEERIRKLISQCRDKGVTPVFMTQPTRYTCDATSSDGTKLGTLIYNDLTLCEHWTKLHLYNSIVVSVCESEHVACIDLESLLPYDASNFYDMSHFTNSGSENMADTIAPLLVPLIENATESKTSP